jgi:hypothetical protein
MEDIINFLGSLKFTHPLYFWIAGVLILLVILFPWAKKRAGLSIDSQYLRGKTTIKSKRFWMLLIPVVIALVLVAGALSDPQVIEKEVTYIYGYPVMLIVDVSGSMGAGINQQTSYEESLEVFNDLIARRGNINFGLILFSAENYVARYFIDKNELFQDTLENKADVVEIANGTWPSRALVKAREFLTDDIKGDGKVIIFISDLYVSGQERTNLAQEITRISLAGINLYILATGEEDQSTAEIPQVSGVKVIDMNDKDGIDLMCQEIYSMQMSPIREEETKTGKSLIPFLVLPALVIIGLCLVLSETRFQKIP